MTKSSPYPKLFTFVLVTYGWSWLFWIPQALVVQGAQFPSGLANFLNSPLNPAAWGPLVGALVATLVFEGWPGLKDLLRRGLRVRFGWLWYLAAWLLFPLLIGGAALLGRLTSSAPWPEAPMLQQLAQMAGQPGGAPPLVIYALVGILIVFFTGGPLQEEFGWRGYLLEKLQSRWNAFSSSLVIGLLWGFWHLPLFFISPGGMYYQHPVWYMVLSIILVSILFTWLYNNTGRSIFAALLFHTAFNWSHWFFPTLNSPAASVYLLGLLAIAAVLVLAIWGWRTLQSQH
jgi:hypothetical protein